VIRTKRIDAWLRGVDERLARRALIGLGIHRGELGAAAVDAEHGLRSPRPVRWTLTDEEFEHRIRVAPDDVALDPNFELRLAVETDAVHDEIVRRLLGMPDVTSAFVAVRRPAGSLRRRAWHWPLRIGLMGYSPDAADVVRAAIGHPSLRRLLDIRRIEDEPAAVDVLIVSGPLVDAVSHVVRVRPVANLVVILDEATEQSAMVEALLATARAATSAVGSALAPPAELPELIEPLIFQASHAEPLDVALTRAAGPELLLYAEPEAMQHAALPEIALRTAHEFDRAGFTLQSLKPLRTQLFRAAEGAFAGEGHEATEIADIIDAAEPELAQLEPPRWCQARVGTDNVLRRGGNKVEFFIGPTELGALATPTPFRDDELPWEQEKVDAFRLTVVFVPVKESLVAQEAELELPRFGRSPSVWFELEVEPGIVTAAARIVVLFRCRVLQTAVLRGRVGRQARLADRAAFVPDLDELDDRRPFDVALFANDTAGQSVLVRSSRGFTRVSHGDDVKPIARKIANLLATAATRSSLNLDTRPARKLLIDLAVAGHDLYMTLERELGSLAGKKRIQVVNARSDFPLPIELVYEREPPDTDAKLCPEYLADPERCNGACNGVDDTTVICPNAFWGMSKTIERHRVEPGAKVDPDGGYLLRVPDQPRAGRREVAIDRIVIGASGRVGTTDSAKLVKALAGSVAAKTWKDLTAALSTDDTQLLVLCPHADYEKLILEIGDADLERGRIAKRYVTGGRDVKPFVLLFGCRTAPTADDPAGFASRFMQTGARAVFHSSTDLLNKHAVELARRLASRLVEGMDPPQVLSEAMTAFRRQAVADGYLAGLSIASIGDADWRV
jgi:CHAT domain